MLNPPFCCAAVGAFACAFVFYIKDARGLLACVHLKIGCPFSAHACGVTDVDSQLAQVAEYAANEPDSSSKAADRNDYDDAVAVWRRRRRRLKLHGGKRACTTTRAGAPCSKPSQPSSKAARARVLN